MVQLLPARGRGAQSNASGRYESLKVEAFDDGWTADDQEPQQLQTTLTAENARRIITTNDSPDVCFNQSINPYRGCEHGCTYCYARPAHAYMGLSPGLDFESKLFFKPEAAALLERELSRPGYVCENIQIGGNTDPYQPVEKKLGITRGIIEVLSRFNHPFSIITKSNLITRDVDLMGPMGRANLCHAAVSITSLDRKLARSMEPRAATPERRLDAVRRLTEAGVPTIVMVAPIVPGLNDHEIEAILERSKEAGAHDAGYVLLRLPLEIKDLFREWLEADHPDRATRVMSLVRQTRGGRDYDPEWRKRQVGEGPVAELIARRFNVAKQRLGMTDRGPPLDVSQFRVPPRAGDQLSLFG